MFSMQILLNTLTLLFSLSAVTALPQPLPQNDMAEVDAFTAADPTPVASAALPAVSAPPAEVEASASRVALSPVATPSPGRTAASALPAPSSPAAPPAPPAPSSDTVLAPGLNPNAGSAFDDGDSYDALIGAVVTTCETTRGSPLSADLLKAAQLLETAPGRRKCSQSNARGSHCTRLLTSGTAAIGICGEVGQSRNCRAAAYWAGEMVKKCTWEGFAGGAVDFGDGMPFPPAIFHPNSAVPVRDCTPRINSSCKALWPSG
ncbi:hypothetical protein EDC01DRAFT_751626 [Geopyxis carbonaria]|nr:hypothetical protein EDC01DRAFT_751626 [Geopyxis carbonaria]